MSISGLLRHRKEGFQSDKFFLILEKQMFMLDVWYRRHLWSWTSQCAMRLRWTNESMKLRTPYTAKRIPHNSKPERACCRTTTCLRRNFPGKLSQTIALNFPARARISAKSGGFFRHPLWIFPLPIEGCSAIGGEIFPPAKADFSASHSGFSTSHGRFFSQPWWLYRHTKLELQQTELFMRFQSMLD